MTKDHTNTPAATDGRSIDYSSVDGTIVEPAASTLAVAKADCWPFPREHFGPGDALMAFIAISLFVIGFLVQEWIEAPDAYPALVDSCVRVLKTKPDCGTAISLFHEQAHSFQFLNFWLAVAEGFKSIAIAIAVTIFVATRLDRKNKESLNETLTHKAQQIGINVFKALYARNHDPALLETLEQQILSKRMIRTKLDVTYTLSDWAPPNDNRLSPSRYVVVRAMVQADFKNIAMSGSSADDTLNLSVSLPNPLLEELKRITGLVSATIKKKGHDDRVVSAAEINAANSALLERLLVDTNDEAVVNFGTLNLLPGEEGGFEIVYTMMKEAEDSELLRCFHTTEWLGLTIIDNTNQNLLVRARSVHPFPLRALASDGNIQKWTLSKIILPQQGLVFWWKRRPAVAAEPYSQEVLG